MVTGVRSITELPFAGLAICTVGGARAAEFFARGERHGVRVVSTVAAPR
jgi:hypothetical protein